MAINLKYLFNVFLYFSSFNEFEYIFIIGFYYILQDYFLTLLLNFKEFAFLSNSSYIEELKYLLITVTFVSLLF